MNDDIDATVADGLLYVANYNDRNVSTYNVSTGEVINSNLIGSPAGSSIQGIDVANGTLYAARNAYSAVGTWNAANGTAINTSFATTAQHPQDVLVLGNTLYASTESNIMTFNASTGAVLNANFITGTSGNYMHMAAADGVLFATRWDGEGVEAYDAATGAAISGFNSAINDTDQRTGIAISAIPEPSTTIFALGSLALLWRKRRS